MYIIQALKSFAILAQVFVQKAEGAPVAQRAKRHKAHNMVCRVVGHAHLLSMIFCFRFPDAMNSGRHEEETDAYVVRWAVSKMAKMKRERKVAQEK